MLAGYISMLVGYLIEPFTWPSASLQVFYLPGPESQGLQTMGR
jgi:hypothetical protein